MTLKQQATLPATGGVSVYTEHCTCASHDVLAQGSCVSLNGPIMLASFARMDDANAF